MTEWLVITKTGEKILIKAEDKMVDGEYTCFYSQEHTPEAACFHGPSAVIPDGREFIERNEGLEL